MRTSTQPRPLKARSFTNYNRVTKKTAEGPYTKNTEYPFHYASKRARKDENNDHVLSGVQELMTLLEGQELIVKQNVVARIAKLQRAPCIHAVRTIIMQEVQRHA